MLDHLTQSLPNLLDLNEGLLGEFFSQGAIAAQSAIPLVREGAEDGESSEDWEDYDDWAKNHTAAEIAEYKLAEEHLYLWIPEILMEVSTALIFITQTAMIATELFSIGTVTFKSWPYFVMAMLPLVAIFGKVWGQAYINPLYEEEDLVWVIVAASISGVISLTGLLSNAGFFGFGTYNLVVSSTNFYTPSVIELILSVVNIVAWVAYIGFEAFFAWQSQKVAKLVEGFMKEHGDELYGEDHEEEEPEKEPEAGKEEKE